MFRRRVCMRVGWLADGCFSVEEFQKQKGEK